MVIPKPTPDLKSNGGKDAELFKDSEDSEDSSQRYVLPKLMSAAIACVLEQCIEELTILGNIGSLPKVPSSSSTVPKPNLNQMVLLDPG